jgi:hypothetical protein
MNTSGILIAVVAILGIGFGHVWVRRMEYHFGKESWPVSLLLGLVLVAASFFPSSDFLSALLAIPGAIFLYAVKELFEQERRVLKGFAPRNPARRYPGDPIAPE